MFVYFAYIDDVGDYGSYAWMPKLCMITEVMCDYGSYVLS